MSTSSASRIAEQVAADLRIRIVEGRLPEASLPKQEQLAADFGVSLASMREALRILDAEGLITVRRGRVGGVDVHRPNPPMAAFSLSVLLQSDHVTLRDLGTALSEMEPLCAASCAERDDRHVAVVPILQANIEACHAAMGDYPEFQRLSSAFHRMLIDFCTNSTLRLTAGALSAIWAVEMDRRVGQFERFDESVGLALLKEHETIVHLIAAGDATSTASFHRLHKARRQEWIFESVGNDTIDATSPEAHRAYRDRLSGNGRDDNLE